MSITIGDVTINTNPSNLSRVDYRKQSQITNELENGSFETFSSGRTMIDVTLIFDYIKPDEFDNFISWITNKINFSRFTFEVAPPSHFSIGAGNGVAVSNCTYNGPPNTKDIFTPRGRLGYKSLEFKFSYPKPIEIGNVDQNGVIAV